MRNECVTNQFSVNSVGATVDYSDLTSEIKIDDHKFTNPLIIDVSNLFGFCSIDC